MTDLFLSHVKNYWKNFMERLLGEQIVEKHAFAVQVYTVPVIKKVVPTYLKRATTGLQATLGETA